ncbi:hypothetical protein AB0F20_05710 [Streptomyces goshikiensis]|uniref:hypothetical protein n=1 Tax=Streptomyces goshikiensis TaxID=1942 RepID=UPI0033F37BB1
MGRTWNAKKRSDIKDFERWLRKGATVYVINRPEHAGRASLWNHAETWSAHTCTGQHPLVGGWQIGANTSAKGFLQWHGTVYEDQPRIVPHASDPGPDCRDEGHYGIRRGEEYRGALHRDDIKLMQEEADGAKDRYDADRKAGRRGRWF